VLGLALAWAIGHLPVWTAILAIVVLATGGIPICTAASKQLGGKKDPGEIVLDEIASVPITFFLVPMSSAAVVFVGFVLNRLFDIVKPPPARSLERLPDGLGVMADDWVAGIYSCLVLHLLLWSGVLASPSG